MRNTRSKLFLQICLFFAIAVALLTSYAFSDDMLLNSILTPAAGFYTAFLIIYGKKSIAPSLLAYFVVVLVSRVVFLDESLGVTFGIVTLYLISVFVEMVLFRYILNKRITRNQKLYHMVNLKDLPYYILVTIVVALVGAIFRSSANMIFYSGGHFASLYKTFAGLIFGMWIFNGAVIFGYYSDTKIVYEKYTALINTVFMVVFFAFSFFVFSNSNNILLLRSLGFIFIFLYILVGLLSSYHMLVYNNLIFMFLYSLYIAIPLETVTFWDMFVDVNLFLGIANLSPIIIKLITNAYKNESNRAEKSLKIMRKIVTTSERHFSNTQYVSFDPNIFFRSFLNEMFDLGSAILPKVEMGSCYIVEDKHLEFTNALGYDIDLLNDLKFKSSVLHKALTKPKIFINADSDSDVGNMKRYPEYIEKYGQLVQSVRFNLIFKDNIIGGMSFDIIRNTNKKFEDKDLETFNSFYKLLEGNLGMGELLYKNNRMINDIIISFVRTVGVYDEYTRVHSEEVANLSRNITKVLNLDSKTSDIAYYSSVVHDIGKISINPDILNKEGKLTDEEYKVVKGHSIHGSDILSQIDGLKDIALFIRHHHERWDGFGYPDRLKGDKIPLVSQIIGVCDAVSAMKNKRVYSEAKSIEEIIQELKDQRGKQFSPLTCDAMIEYLSGEEIVTA